MAARKIDFVPPTPAPAPLPTPPDATPAVVEAVRVLGLATRERDRAAELLRQAEAALEADDAAAGAELLDRLAAGDPADIGTDLDARADVDRARRRLAAAAEAVGLAEIRARHVLAEAREQFSRLMRPILGGALAGALEAARVAGEKNQVLRQVAAFAHNHDPSAPDPSTLALPLPTPDRVDDLGELRAEVLDPQPVGGVPPGRVLVRILADVMPYTVGETAALPEDDATMWIRAGIAAPVRDDDARRLGVDRLVKFDRSQQIKLSKDFTHRDGALTPAGTVAVYDAELSARIVNLGFGESMGDAHGD